MINFDLNYWKSIRGEKMDLNIVPHFSSQTCEWATPQKLFDELNSEFQFTLDPCATEENAKCEKFYTIRENGLAKSWEGENVFVNPPYGNQIGKWMKKCFEEGNKFRTNVLALIPARTDTKWFHEYCKNALEIRFIKGRLRFVNSKNPAPFPSLIIVF